MGSNYWLALAPVVKCLCVTMSLTFTTAVIVMERVNRILHKVAQPLVNIAIYYVVLSTILFLHAVPSTRSSLLVWKPEA